MLFLPFALCCSLPISRTIYYTYRTIHILLKSLNELGVMEQTTVRDCIAQCDADELCLSFEYVQK